MKHRTFTVLWSLLRLPLALLLLYSLREPAIDAIERIFDLVRVTFFAIEVLSTPVSRLALAASLVGTLLVVARSFASARRNVRFWLLLGSGVALFGALFYFTSTSPLFLSFVVLLLATNLIPLAWIDETPERTRAVDRVMALAVGVAEAFAFRRYIAWVAGKAGWKKAADWARSERISTLLPPFVIASCAAAVLLNSTYLVGFEQWFRVNPEVEVMAKGDFNWIELDESGRYLFVTGHGVPRLRRYDLLQPDSSYIEADVDTGAAQSFSYDPEANELYVYHGGEHAIIYLDAGTLTKKRAVSVSDLSPGDPWIIVDRHTDTLTIVSEADERTGHSFLVLRRADGVIVDKRYEEAGNIARHPKESLLYLSYFRRSNQVKIYDLRRLEIVAEAPSDKRVDRMQIYEREGELLVASPFKSEVIRYDARSLTELGRLRSTFGIRVLALDESRDVLLGGSLVTGLLAMIDVATGQTLDTQYLGPWLRTIAVNPATGFAYVSSNGSLFKLDLGHEQRMSRR